MLKVWFLVLFIAFSPWLKAQILPSFGDSRTGTTGFQFLKITPDARAAGLGKSIIAITDDVNAMYWNPAGITRVDTFGLHAAAGYTDYYGGVSMQHVGLVRQIGGDIFLGANLLYLNTDDMPVTTEFQPFGTGQTYRAINMAAGLTLAARLTDRFSFGLTGKYLYESMADINTDAVVFDFGFQYDVGLANTRFAVAVSNFGFNSRPTGELQVIDFGGAEVVTDFEEIAVPAYFRLGFAWDAIKQENHRLTAAIQLNHPTDNNETFSVGAEYLWNKLFFARAGYEFGADETGLPAFGFGLNLKRNFGAFRLDYGFSQKEKLGVVHRITLGVGLL